MGAEVLPTDKIASINSRYLNPFSKASISPINAPAPAPSVGENTPNHIPPRTATITAMIPHKLIMNCLVDTLSGSASGSS